MRRAIHAYRKAGKIAGLILLSLGLPAFAHAQVIEQQSCPSGTIPITAPGTTTINNANGQILRQWCVDNNGNMYSTGHYHSGTETFKYLNNIRFADQFAGADWIAKVNAADADLGVTPGTIYVSSALAGQTASTALSLSVNHTLIFDNGTYSTTVCPVLTNTPGISLIGQGTTIFSCVPTTSTPAVFKIDGTGGQSGVIGGITISGIIFSGNANTIDGLLIKKVAGSYFRIRVKNVTGAGIHLQFSLINTFETPTVSQNIDSMTTVPSTGMSLDTDGVGSSNANTINTPRFEGLTGGTGISLVSANNNIFNAGTSEGNAVGVSIATASTLNTFNGIDMEVNTTRDASIAGSFNKFNNVLAASTAGSVLVSGNHNWLDSGEYVSISNTGIDNEFRGVRYAANGGAFTNTGTNITKRQVFNLTSSSFDIDVIPGVLNAAGTQQTGWHIVSDTATLSGGTVTVTLSGSAVFTGATTFSCAANDDTGLNPVKVVNNSGSSITFSGTTTDVLRYICVGN